VKTTLEEASQCPTCHEPALKLREGPHPQRARAKLIYFRCANNRCPMQGQGHVVQINPDGTIPIRQAGPKQYPELPNDFGQTEAKLRAELEAQRRGGAEIASPYRP